MNKAQELKIKAKAALEKKKEEDKTKLASIKKAVDYFIKHFENQANNGRFSCETSCIVKMKDGSFFCQTDSGGDGFEIVDLELLQKELMNEGFNVKMPPSPRGSGYLRLIASWE